MSDAPQAGDVTTCYRCNGEGCGHCGQTGKLRWIAYGHSEPYRAGPVVTVSGAFGGVFIRQGPEPVTREEIKSALGCIHPRMVDNGRGGQTMGLGMEGLDEAADRILAIIDRAKTEGVP